MKKYYIEWGLGGGFGGINNAKIIECNSMEEAEKEAWGEACEVYDSYAGTGGLRDITEIMEDDEVEEDEAQGIYEEEREDWLDYAAEEYNPAIHDEKIEMYK